VNSVRLGDILRLAAQRDPRKVAMIAGDRQISYAAYDAAANRFAHLLADAGIAKGERIAAVLFNSPEYAITHFGNARAGSVLVHISPMYAAPEIARIVDRTRPRILVIDAEIADKIEQVRDRLKSVERVIVVGRDTGGGDVPDSFATDFEDAISVFPDTDPGIDIDPADPVAMTFTGGTTGEPKGAVVSHNARFVSAWTTALEHRVTGEDITGILTPMFHAVGLMIWYQATILAGCTSVIFRKWDAGEFIRQTERHGISSVFMVPVQARDLIRSDAFDPARLKTLKNIGAGGALTPEGLIGECRDALPHCDYTDHYGQSETGILTVLKPWESETHKGSIGRAAAGVDLRIADENGDAVPPGTIGELICRGPFMMDGYFENNAETAAYFRDGWGWSGDLAVADEDGFVTLVGRSKEMIVSGGINVYPREIEITMEEHPAVLECTAFGVPDERWGEALISYIVLRDGQSADEDTLLDFCAEQLARYKRPREIVFVGNIPKTPSGKIQKPLLRDAYLDGRVLP
jgi:acyl-CoA synthetase (AMP-forming)/AMP-acid ligase II